MDIERIGERTVFYVSRLYYYLLGILIVIIRGLLIIRKILSSYETRFFKSLFETRDIDFKDYLILKIQTVIMVFFISAILFIFNYLGKGMAFWVMIITGTYTIYFIFNPLKYHFKEDFKAYRDSFLSFLGIVCVILLSVVFGPLRETQDPSNLISIFLLSMVMVGGFSIYFKTRYSRDFTFGRIVTINGLARVKVNYDIRSSVKPGVFTVEKIDDAKKGDRVKLSIKRSFMNLKGSQVLGILEVVGEDEGERAS